MENNLIILILLGISTGILGIFLCAGIVFFFRNKKVQYVFRQIVRLFLQKRKIDYLEYKNFSNQLAGVLTRLSKDVVGGLIVVEQKDDLTDYVKLGYSVRAKFSSEFATNIFYNKLSPLHDGGMIVRNTEIISVSSYFPVTKQHLESSFGARHRAAVGISETTDALAFVVSETTGNISYAQKGKIKMLAKTANKLTNQIYELLVNNNPSDLVSDEIIIQGTLEKNRSLWS
ncbi:diadenylate cyclase [Mycoplasmoides fastidiosum]|uniref:Diadenylate cyclase n=1 Tax=Mycoplasmoides fastidiosum TaxID=92758 RepID=A0ABU0LYK4_9BACT|nr:diadenylate cyclase [Mycoplasmoides fastidiosum]MDQ0513759.1 diadenylate cyclase [Mycoplasmoides fastidiosum]UUD37820.1 diadenylate cyclase [Mycoplasmoides fastidiosum]